ncbi:hypothetical protein PRIPAC_91562 [Pristionchus pacificus]|uniref:RING-type domain-containing protein n=1 Tax=Pristionchus pacificus TaxID=54126 RepID=A0A2A6BAS2_PRIPA|nr:hypothetical protein PRIPAC_91562 [Pristionchus pacificus]|eukprot:PDM62964.1 hypothetical protein PRIPAC_50179 [Pristionchus pacificus]
MDRRDPPEAAQARADAAAQQLNEAIERRDGIVAQIREIDREREALINEMRIVMMQANDEEERAMERAIQRGNRFLEMQRELERAGREIMDENEEFARREREGAVNGMGRDNIPGNEQARAEGAPEAELNRILERQNRLLQLQQEIEREIPVMGADNEPGRQILRPEHQVWIDPDEVNVEIEDVQPIPEERPNPPFPLLRINRQPPVGLGARMQLMNRIRRENIEAARERARLRRERERAMIELNIELDNGEEGRQQRRPIGIPFEVVNRPPPPFPDLREDERNGYLERIREEERERRRRWRAERERAREEDREEEIMEEVDAVGDEEDEAQQVQALQGLGGRLLDLLREMVEAHAANRRGAEAGGQGDRPAVPEEMVREAQRMRAEDIIDESSTRYSRACSVCTIDNPQTRAVYSRCGHIVCFPCAVENATRGASGGKCVFCRQQSGFVKLFEEEYCIEKKKEENRSIMRTVIEYGKIMCSGGRIHSLITHPLSWAIARDVTCIGLAVVLYRKAPPNARIFVGAQLIALANLSLALRLKQFK